MINFGLGKIYKDFSSPIPVNSELSLPRGRGRKVMHLPCKQAQAGALPATSTILNYEYPMANDE
ncbi:MAG: hypothetical protein JWQ71_694 [Pedosphaera sp.]|nr:hypothetical protein [Pedosphaera sp.]